MAFTWWQLLLFLVASYTRRFGAAGAMLGFVLPTLKPLVPTGDVPAGVLAAPEALKDAVVEFLEGLVAKVDRPLVRLVLTRAVKAVPTLVDTLWDQLFEARRVGHRHPTQLSATTDYQPEDVELTAAMAAELAVCG